MLKRLWCKHEWRKTFDGLWVKSQYACIKCGMIEKVYHYDEGSWRVNREAKGDTFK